MQHQSGQSAEIELEQLVVFELAGESYGIPIHRVREIIRVPTITKVPRTPEFIEGVINLRGGVIPVIDLAKRFGLQSSEQDDDRRIIVVEMREWTLGMIVDGVSEVLRVDPSVVEPPSPYIVTIATKYIAGVAKVDDGLVILLDLDQVLLDDEHERLANFELAEDRSDEGI